MDTLPTATKYKNHRFPVEIISHAVWLYFRFCLSFRDVEELLFARGVVVTYEAIRKWCRKFGQQLHLSLRGTPPVMKKGILPCRIRQEQRSEHSRAQSRSTV